MTLFSMKHTYTQDPDCCGPDLPQTLIVETDDGGGGYFLIISTERWAFNDEADIDALAARLKDMLLKQRKAAIADAEKEVK